MITSHENKKKQKRS